MKVRTGVWPEVDVGGRVHVPTRALKNGKPSGADGRYVGKQIGILCHRTLTDVKISNPVRGDTNGSEQTWAALNLNIVNGRSIDWLYETGDARYDTAITQVVRRVARGTSYQPHHREGSQAGCLRDQLHGNRHVQLLRTATRLGDGHDNMPLHEGIVGLCRDS